MRKTKTTLLVLITICMLIISGSLVAYSVTYSKLVHQSKSENVSSVAMFGVIMTWSDNAFLTTYEKGDPSKVVVESNDKTLAPSLSNSMTLSLRGKCEIAFNLTITLDEQYSEHWKESNLTTAKPYHPIQLKANSSMMGVVEITDNVISIDYEAVGEDLVEDITITWEWPASVNDDADTYMSTLHDVATYSLSAETLATQID